MKHYQWSDLSSDSFDQIFQHKPILILGSRDISTERIVQLTQKLLTKKPVVWGCLAEKYISGLENCPQFQTLNLTKLKKALVDLQSQTKNSSSRISTLLYPQTEVENLIKASSWSGIIAINGSWHRAFHYRSEYKQLTKRKIPYKLVSSFVDKAEALSYFKKIEPKLPTVTASKNQTYSPQQLMEFAHQASQRSFDYTFQTGAVLAKNQKFLLSAHNRVEPYETYMLHCGATKEKQLAGFQDISVYDTAHAEVELMFKVMHAQLDLTNCSLYINLMPCPVCAKMLAKAPLKEVVYQLEHSDGLARKILERNGIRMVKI